MVNRSGITKRMNAKSLKKLQTDKMNNPEKYIHETSDYSKFLAMQYDAKQGTLAPFKEEEYKKLKEKYKNGNVGTEE